MSISLDDFQQLDLRVGTIEVADPIEGANKLLKLTVNIGEKRTLVAGLARHYEPNDLVGQQIIIVANLEPKEVMGVESCGMLLAASDGDTVALVQPDQTVSPGSTVS